MAKVRLRDVVYEYRERNGRGFAYVDDRLICTGDVEWMPHVLTRAWPLEVVIRMSIALLVGEAA